MARRKTVKHRDVSKHRVADRGEEEVWFKKQRTKNKRQNKLSKQARKRNRRK